MKITALVDNISCDANIESEHGLSLYIETTKENILVDFGQSDMFIRNAEKLGVDMRKVTMAVLSHGHYDHGGGLEGFLRINTQAPIYCHKKAFLPHYSLRDGDNMTFIGLDNALLRNKQFITTDHFCRISDEIILFSSVDEGCLSLKGNKKLFMGINGKLTNDDFSHEQNLLISDMGIGKTVLITGCAHMGIVNILEHIKIMNYDWPDYIIGGFHLSGGSRGLYEDQGIIREVTQYLVASQTVSYTCHCTGNKAYEAMKQQLGDNMHYLSAGMTIEI